MDSQLFGHSWLDTALESEEDQDSSTYSFQDAVVKSDEVFKNPVHLFGQFVLAVPSDDWEDIEQLEFSAFVRDLCERTPSVAQYVVQEILKHLAKNSRPDAQVSKESGLSTNPKQTSKRSKQTTDHAYQPPKPPTKQLETGRDEAEDPDTAVKCHALVGDDSVTSQPGHDNKCTNQSSDNLTSEENRSIQETQSIQEAPSIHETQLIQGTQPLQTVQLIQETHPLQKVQSLQETQLIQKTPSIQEIQPLQTIQSIQETQSTQECKDIPETVEKEAFPQERVQDLPTNNDSDICPSGQHTKSTNQNESNPTTEEAQPIQEVQSIQKTQFTQETQPSPKAHSLQKSEEDIPETVLEKEDVPREGVQDQHMIDDSIICQSNHDSISINQNSDSLGTQETQPLQECDEDILETIDKSPLEGFQDQLATDGQTTCTEVAQNLPNPMDSSDNTIEDEAHERSPIFIADSTKNNQTTFLPLPSETEQREATLEDVETASHAQDPSATSTSNGTEPYKSTLSTATPSTPIRQIAQLSQSPFSDDQTIITPNTTIFTPTVSGGNLSPLTESDGTPSLSEKTDITLRDEVTSPSSCTGQQQTKLSDTALTQAQQGNGEQSLPIQDCQPMPPSPPRRVLPTLTEMVANIIQTIHVMTNGQEVPSEVHCEILSTIRSSLDVIPVAPTKVGGGEPTRTTSSSKPSSASMWLNMLEASEAHSKKATILKMIGLMGASEWYEKELAKAGIDPPRTKKGRPRKRLATIFLDEYLKKPLEGTPIESPGKLTPKDSKDHSLSLNSAGIQKSILTARRKKLTTNFKRGRTLRDLVQMTHLGILFDQDIWSYVKSSKEEINKVASLFQADSQKMKLLSILDEQVELLVKTGQPDLSRFFESLESHAITTPKEVSSLRAKYGQEREPVPQGYLDTTINQLVKRISHLLCKETLSDDDPMMVNGTVELSYGIFDRLRSKEWLYGWDIRAILEMTDRPISVKLGYSNQLHKKDAEGKITPMQNPFRRWRSEIDTYRRENKSSPEGPLVYFCPLHLNTNHLTLLEINEQTKMIYHYDSMASRTTIYRKTKSTPTKRQIMEEFGYLNFGYVEAPCPQQNDGWSCGLMAIRNAKQRMTGLPVRSWSDKVDPERVIMEVLGDCQKFLENDILQPTSLLKKRKRVAEGLKNDALEPTRVSKRLKQISVDL